MNYLLKKNFPSSTLTLPSVKKFQFCDSPKIREEMQIMSPSPTKINLLVLTSGIHNCFALFVQLQILSASITITNCYLRLSFTVVFHIAPLGSSRHLTSITAIKTHRRLKNRLACIKSTCLSSFYSHHECTRRKKKRRRVS